MEKLYNIILLMVLIASGSIFYLLIDAKCNLTNKISSNIKIDKKWQPFFFACSSMGLILIMAIISTPKWLIFLAIGIMNGIMAKVGYANNKPITK